MLTPLHAARVASLVLVLSLPSGALPVASSERGSEAPVVGTDFLAVVSREEYRPRLAAGELQAPNRSQGLRTRFAAGGPRIEPQLERCGPGVALVCESWGRVGAMRPLASVTPRLDGDRVLYERPGFVEWYANDPRGIEQGFDVFDRPAGSGTLRIRLLAEGVDSARLSEDGNEIVLDAGDSRGPLRYGALSTADADGRALASHLAVDEGHIVLEIDDRAARYPLRVDPLVAGAWSVAGSGQYGYCVAAAGDVNGDGYGDVLVGAPELDAGLGPCGEVWLFLGSSTGLRTSYAWIQLGTQPDGATFSGGQLGFSVATAGDVDGDGLDDVLLGEPGWDDVPSSHTTAGRVRLFRGSATSGLQSTPSFTIVGDQAAMSLGFSVSTAGDVNGDGYYDILVGAPGADTGPASNAGRADVYLGSAAGIVAGPAWQNDGVGQAGAQTGYSVATAGDVDGDGYDDVVVGSPFEARDDALEGRARLFFGSASGPQLTPGWAGEGNFSGSYYGRSVAMVGDVLGDGHSAFIVGAEGTNSATVYGWFGSLSTVVQLAYWDIPSSGVGFGWSVAGAGDVDGDGYADIVIGAPNWSDGSTFPGAAFFVRGGVNVSGETPERVAIGTTNGGRYGACVAPAGDTDGDGFGDVVVGEALAGGGLATLLRGAGGGLVNDARGTVRFDVAPGGLFPRYVEPAGDVNGDGYSDVLVGDFTADVDAAFSGGLVKLLLGGPTGLSTAPAWSASGDIAEQWFGRYASGVGDLNGDGYEDVMIADQPNGDDSSIRFRVYAGLPTGLGATESWSRTFDLTACSRNVAPIVAGDLNGDGLRDLAFAISSGDCAEAHVDFHYGGYGWPSTTESGNITGLANLSEYANMYGVAGDANRDGFTDLLVANPLATAFGVVWAGWMRGFRWSAAGPLSGPSAWGFTYKANVGNELRLDGDVDGDGFGDLLEGRGQSPVGGDPFVGALAIWNGASPWTFAASFYQPGTSPFEQLGGGYSTFADVDGDHYSDVIAGEPTFELSSAAHNLGRILRWPSTPTGPTTSASLIDQGTSADSYVGGLLRGVGDVNGDGFQDIMTIDRTGLPSVKVFYGGAGPGLDRRARQMRPDTHGPVGRLGMSPVPNAIELGMRERSAAGRSRVRTEYEMKSLATQFNAHNTTLSAWHSLSGSSDVTHVMSYASISGAPGHWRARTVTTHPFFHHSPWVSPAGMVPSLQHFRAVTGTTDAELVPEAAPSSLALALRSANPSRGASTLAFSLPEAGEARLAIYDVGGRSVVELARGWHSAGTHEVRWDGARAGGERVRPGVYFARLVTATGEMVLSVVRLD